MELSELAQNLRVSIIQMLAEAGSGHPGGALGMSDVFATLYGKKLNHRPEQPDWPERDRLILSNGHTCPVLYAVLAETGYFPKEKLQRLRKLDSGLEGHPHRGSLPGVENTSGPLGQGLSQACGLAAGLRLQKSSARVYCLMSDGEHEEGQTWEAYLFGAKQNLSNLTVIIDRNYIQIDGPTEEVLGLDPLAEKVRAFNWNVIEIDGHNFAEIEQAIDSAQATTNKPTAIVCKTIPGKGVSFMEGKFEWHGKAPSREQAGQALKELGATE